MRRFALSGLLALAACAHAAGPRSSDAFAGRIAAFHTAAILAPDVKAFEVTAGGAFEEKKEWTQAASANALQSASAALHEHGIAASALQPDAADGDEVEDVRALWRVVALAIDQTRYGEDFPLGNERFDYSLGPLSRLLAKQHADLMVMVWGVTFVPTFGHQLVTALAGSGVPQQGHLSVALVDPSGEVLWFNQASIGGDDLRDPDTARKLAKAVFDQLEARAR